MTQPSNPWMTPIPTPTTLPGGGIPGVNMTLDPTWQGAGYPSVPGNAPPGDLRTIDIGNGLVAVVDDAGNVYDVRSAETGGAAYHSPEWRPGERELEERQLDQFDRQLDADTKQKQNELAEMRRQFNKTHGLEKERLAAEIRLKEKELKQNMQIARLDARTRLGIAKMEGQLTARGQDISREQFAAEMGARRSEFAIEALRNDPVAQAMFMLGDTGGTTPLEVAAQQFPVMEAPPVRNVNVAQTIGNLPALPKGFAFGGTIRPGGEGLVGEFGPEIVRDIPGGGTRVMPIPGRVSIPTTPAPAPGMDPRKWLMNPDRRYIQPMPAGPVGANVNDVIQGGESAAPVEDPLVVKARETVAKMLEGTFRGGPMQEFGGLPVMESIYGATPISPAQMAPRFFNLPLPLRQAAMSAWGVRGMPADEAMRRMRAATPSGLPAGFRMGYR